MASGRSGTAELIFFSWPRFDAFRLSISEYIAHLISGKLQIGHAYCSLLLQNHYRKGITGREHMGGIRDQIDQVAHRSSLRKTAKVRPHLPALSMVWHLLLFFEKTFFPRLRRDSSRRVLGRRRRKQLSQ